MELYPDDFPADKVVNKYDPTEMTIAWRRFEGRLTKLFGFFHKSRPHGDEYKLFQVCSCFANKNAPNPNNSSDSTNPNERADSNYDTQVTEALENSQILATFAPLYVSKCNKLGKTYKPADVFLRRVLEFFLPIFIWEFNHAKKLLINVDKKIYSWRINV